MLQVDRIRFCEQFNVIVVASNIVWRCFGCLQNQPNTVSIYIYLTCRTMQVTRCPYTLLLDIKRSEVAVCLKKRMSVMKRRTRIVVVGDSRTRSFHMTLYTLLTYLPLPTRWKGDKWKIDWKAVDKNHVLDLVSKIRRHLLSQATPHIKFVCHV